MEENKEGPDLRQIMRDLSTVIRPVKKFWFKNGQSKVYTNQSIGKATKLDFSWRTWDASAEALI